MKQTCRKSVGGKFPMGKLQSQAPKKQKPRKDVAAPEAHTSDPDASRTVWESPQQFSETLQGQKGKWRLKRGGASPEMSLAKTKKRRTPEGKEGSSSKALRNADFEGGPRPCKWGCGTLLRNPNVLGTHQSRCKLKPPKAQKPAEPAQDPPAKGINDAPLLD
eukprot:TRINITY_DN8674_c0_g1_i1.p1 TRINITY_DN8674_c0_g1~~TRINITY_DN8674_c0_g1_i1.p1  ORF type:complete len:162 (+),score=20.63 TRINITY_DN8674_c0_g1_i1:181-666(+)